MLGNGHFYRPEYYCACVQAKDERSEDVHRDAVRLPERY